MTLEGIAIAFVDPREICHSEVAVVIGMSTLSMRQGIRSVCRNSAELSKIEITSLDGS